MISILNHIVSEGAIREGKDEFFMSSAYLWYMKIPNRPKALKTVEWRQLDKGNVWCECGYEQCKENFYTKHLFTPVLSNTLFITSRQCDQSQPHTTNTLTPHQQHTQTHTDTHTHTTTHTTRNNHTHTDNKHNKHTHTTNTTKTTNTHWWEFYMFVWYSAK